MNKGIYLSIIMPAFNEEKRITYTLEQSWLFLAQKPYTTELIVVDDGSSDSTASRAEQLKKHIPGLRILSNGQNRGKGYAARRGVLEAKGQFIGFMDADYKTPIEELDELLPWLEQGYHVVIGSRASSESVIEVYQPLYRRLGSWAFDKTMHALVGLPHISDTQCGFKFFQRNAALDIFRRQQVDGYMFDVEILLLATGLGYRLKEVPIRWHNEADSRYKLVSGTWRNFRELTSIRRSLNGLCSERALDEPSTVAEDSQ